jgi:hypothetical protein
MKKELRLRPAAKVGRNSSSGKRLSHVTESNWMRVRKLLRERKLKMEQLSNSSTASAEASTDDEYS